MKYQKWLKQNVGSQKGKIIIITGANSGIGFYATQYLAYQGATIIMACRNLNKAEKAKQSILNEFPEANLIIKELNLASIASITSFALDIKEEYEQIDGLINNAGVYSMPRNMVTQDGYEITMGTNYLGTYILTCQLLPLLIKTTPSRIVNVSSIVHRKAKINYNDFFSSNTKKMSIYARSKLAVLIFSQLLGEYCQNKYPNILVTAAHPGITATNLFAAKSGGVSVGFAKIASAFLKVFTHRPAKASLSLVLALTDNNAKINDYYGPRGLLEISGYPKLCKKAKTVYQNHQRLLDISKKLTGYTLP